MARSSPASIPKQLLLAPGTADNLGAGLCLCHPGAGLAAGAVPLSPFGDRAAVLVQPPGDPAQRHPAAGLFAGAGADRAAGLHGGGGGRQGRCRNMPHGFDRFGNNFAVPALFLHMFPAWFAGVAFAAIAIGALVPAAIMSIACGNLFTRNIYKEFIAPDCTPAHGSAGRQDGRLRRSSWARCSSCWSCRPPTPSSCSFWAASGSARPCRRCCSRFTPAASIRGRCWPAGPRASAAGTWMVVELGLQKLDLSAAHFRA